MIFQSHPATEISDARNRVLISPAHGARILVWEHDGRQIITWPEEADWSRILKVRGGNPILFPFLARHFVDGKNELWRDAKGIVRPMPQHGFARDAIFTVIEDEDDKVVRMRLIASDMTWKEYPFAFQFDVVARLLPGSRLEVRFETTNLGESPLPYYPGHHFYLAIPHGDRADWLLELPCADWGRQAPEGSIIHEKATTYLLNLADPSLIDRFQIRPRKATVTLRHLRTSQCLTFDLRPPGTAPWYAVTTWTESPTSDFFCIEPWMGLPNAIHHGEGLRYLEAAKTEIATCILDGTEW